MTMGLHGSFCKLGGPFCECPCALLFWGPTLAPLILEIPTWPMLLEDEVKAWTVRSTLKVLWGLLRDPFLDSMLTGSEDTV